MNLLGHIANSNMTPIDTIGFIFKYRESDIIGGANNTPNKLNIYTTPAAVDCTSTLNDSVCKKAINAYATTK